MPMRPSVPVGHRQESLECTKRALGAVACGHRPVRLSDHAPASVSGRHSSVALPPQPELRGEGTLHVLPIHWCLDGEVSQRTVVRSGSSSHRQSPEATNGPQ